MKKLPVFGLLMLLWSGLHSQEIWSLSACIQHALENNVGLQQAKIAVDLAGITVKENRHKMLPDLNGNLNSGISFGRNIDPTTNGFTTEDILYSNYSLSSGVTLFQGGLIRNTIRQSQLNQKAAMEDYIQAGNDLALAIATYYLQVLMAQEQVETAKKNLEISNQQLVQIEKLIGV
ncbi:MAG TPA: TolC family protein, partial [Saprospiraceae bacterium]|nr:TolC family protein [Saprospiraceae bacterium]